MPHPSHIEEQAEKLNTTPEDLIAFYRGLQPLKKKATRKKTAKKSDPKVEVETSTEEENDS